MLCDDFRKKTAQDRKQFVEVQSLCSNCLGKHKKSDCPSKRTCSVCSEQHHTALHDAFRKVTDETNDRQLTHVARSLSQNGSSVLLATARIYVEDAFGNQLAARALIDQGSGTSIITGRLVRKLKLPRRKASVAVIGAGDVQTGVAKGRVSFRIRSRLTKASTHTNAIILPRITCYRGVTGIPPVTGRTFKDSILPIPNLRQRIKSMFSWALTFTRASFATDCARAPLSNL